MLNKLLLFVLFRSCAAVIYELNATDFARMPPIYHLDDYEQCFDNPGGLYCTTELVLVSDEPSPLLTMIQEYSAHKTTHYNHTRLRHGICITQTCEQFYNVSKGDLIPTLEACLNESLYNRYKLKAKVLDNSECSKREKNKPIDYVDMAVGVVCAAILMANLVASVCDSCLEESKDNTGLRFLYCFSIRRNWKKLISSAAEGQEARLQALKGLHGVRVLNTLLVVGSHAIMPGLFLVQNPEYIEYMYSLEPYHVFTNGTLIMQTFLLISSFLLVYNWMIYSEKREPSWKLLPKQFLMRWLRLTPSYAVILALTATWFGRITSGPYWMKVVGREMYHCRRDWWKHLLYINNYSDDSECMTHAWYLACDTQLYYMAAIVFLICRTVRTRKVVLSLLFVGGIVMHTLITYYRDLHGVLIVDPEFALTIFMNDPTFNEVYKRGHTNLTGYIIGMTMGYMVYDWQKAGGNPKSFRKYRYLYWTLFPLGLVCSYTGTVYYGFAPPPPLYINLLYSALLKPVFGIIIGTIILGVIIQFEGFYRSILEWHGWALPSRLSFSAYLLHVVFIRNQVAMRTHTFTVYFLTFTEKVISTLVFTFVAALFFWILVEGPFGSLIREYFKPAPVKEVDEESPQTKDEKITDSPKKIESKEV